MMKLVKRLFFVMLVACGGTVSPNDDSGAAQDAASELPSVSGGDAAGDVEASVETKCIVEAGALACDAGKGWAWGDVGIGCSDEPCPVGAACYTIGAGSQSGACE